VLRNIVFGLALVLFAAPALAGSGAGLPASYYWIHQRVDALERFIQANRVEIPFGSGATGIRQGTSSQGPVWLEVTARGADPFVYDFTISRAREVEARTKDNTIRFELRYTTQATGRPQRLLLATGGEFDESNQWEIVLGAQGQVTAVNARYQGPRFLWGGRKVNISATF
jgi:hypothetical protein